MNSSTLCHIIETKTYSWEELAYTRMVWFHQHFLYSCDDEVKCVMVAKKKKTIFIEESHYTSVRFYFKLEDIPHSNSKDKIRVKKYEAYDIFIGRRPFKEQERLYREEDRSNNQNLE